MVCFGVLRVAGGGQLIAKCCRLTGQVNERSSSELRTRGGGGWLGVGYRVYVRTIRRNGIVG